MTRNANLFRVDTRGSDHQYLDVHVSNIATVHIKHEDEGIVVDIYPFKDFNSDPVAGTWAHLHDLSPDEQPLASVLTPWQRTALSTYDMGDFAYLAEPADRKSLNQSLRDCGDSLLRFIVSELSAREDCESYEDAIRRMEIARNQLSDLIEDLQDCADGNEIRSTSPRFRVRWTIDSDAADPINAAREALKIQRDKRSIATVFTVRETDTGKTTSVDLANHQPQ